MSRSRAAVVYPLTEELSKPVVPDVVEVAGHGNLYNVLGPVLHHPLPQPVQRRVRATSRSETMRAVQEILFENRRQHPGYGLLHHAVFEGG
jgi:hypothetical protein